MFCIVYVAQNDAWLEFQAYEDVLRHRADREVNMRQTTRINAEGEQESIQAQEIRVSRPQHIFVSAGKRAVKLMAGSVEFFKGR